MSDMATLEHMSTNIVANPIDKPLMADVVVAKVGHIPNNKTNVGFSFIKPLYINFKLFIVNVFLNIYNQREGQGSQASIYQEEGGVRFSTINASVAGLLIQLLRGTCYGIGLRRLHILTISAEGIIHGSNKSL